MKTSVFAQFYINSDMTQHHACKELRHLVLKSPCSTTSFGSTERTERDIREANANAISDILSKYRRLFFKSSSGKFKIMIAQKSKNYFTMNLFIEEPEWHRLNSDLWEKWVDVAASQKGMIYGFLCTEQERQAKNMVSRELPGGGRSTSGVGVAISDLKKFLPGVYWKNYLPIEILAEIAKARLENLPNWIVDNITSDKFSIRFNGSLIPYTPAERDKFDAALIDVLGKEHVFEKSRLSEDYCQYASLLEKIP